jgi:predicted aldo/keto reductase-like oxidoreductase
MNIPEKDRPTRRSFLAGAGLGAAAMGLAGCRKEAAAPPAAPTAVATKVDEAPPAAGPILKRELGATGLQVTVVGIGSPVNGPQPVRRAIDLGLNYIDTAMAYQNGHGEEQVGEALQGVRDKVILCTKWEARPGHPKADLLALLEGSLKRLKTDHVDIMLVHGLGGDTPARLDNPGLREAMDAAKSAGKVRFFGASSHDGQRDKFLRYAIDKGLADVILVAMSAGNFPQGVSDLLDYAHQKKVGVLGMKSTQGNHKPPEQAGAHDDVYQAQLKWVLLHGADCVVHTGVGNDTAVQDEALVVARGPLQLTEREHALVHEYTRLVSGDWCRGCGHVCGGACPDGVRIADVLRYRMYATGYGDLAGAREQYAALEPAERLSARCGDCLLCQQACPHGLPVVEQLFETRSRLA